MNTIVLESAKGVKGGKVQLAFSQVVNTGTSSGVNVLGLLNASDERFNQPKPRYVWLSAEPQDIKAQFGIDVSSVKEGEELVINAVDPRLSSAPETQLNIQIEETVNGTDYEVRNFEKTAKRAGKDGDFILSNGMYIYVRAKLVAGTPVHKIIKDTESENTTPSIAATLGV